MMQNWMSRGERRAAWGMLLLSVVAVAASVYLILSHPNGGDYFIVGVVFTSINTYNGVRVALMLWENARG